MYPSYGMREMADNDVLYDASRAADVRRIMESMGFVAAHLGGDTDDAYHKEPVCNFEMHWRLFGDTHEPRFREYYRDVERLLVPDGDGTACRHFRDEDFYVYMVVHEYKHYHLNGTGARSLLDAYVFLRERGDALDWAYVMGELEGLGVADFERRNRGLAMRLFGGGELGPEDEEMLSYVLGSGAFGTMEQGIENAVRRSGRAGYLLGRAFPPRGEMVLSFPVLRRAPALLPACWAIRIVGALVGKRQLVLSQVKAALKADAKE
jgi:hypothetical protein